MSNTSSNVQARSPRASRAPGRSAISHSGTDAQGASSFPTGSFYNDRPFGGVSRHQLELLRYANLQVLMILARD